MIGRSWGWGQRGVIERSRLETKQEVSRPSVHIGFNSGEDVMGGPCGTYGGEYKCIQD